jgi:hypothetical protein
MTQVSIFLAKGDNQVKSKDLGLVATQRELDLYRQPEPNTAPIEMIRKQETAGAAFTLACSSCGKADQEIYEFCHIDAGTFSKMKKGLATLQAEDLSTFCYAVNNRIWPEWCAFQIGCTLVEIKSEAERQRDAEKERADKAEAENALLRSLLVGKTS